MPGQPLIPGCSQTSDTKGTPGSIRALCLRHLYYSHELVHLTVSRCLLSPYCVPGILLGARELGGSWTQPLLSLSFRSSGGRNREIRCLENWSWELGQVRGSEMVSGHWGPKDEPNVSRQREQHEQMARAHVCMCVPRACVCLSCSVVSDSLRAHGV